MSTVELIGSERAPLLARPYFEDGDPGPIVGALAHVPELLEVTVAFISAVLGASSIDVRTKELVILRTSAQLDCRYCVQSHTPVALDSGLERAEVDALRRRGGPSEVFRDTRTRALVDWIDALTRGIGVVDASITAAMQAQFSDPEIVELTLLVGTTMMLNRFCTGLDLPTAPATLERLAAEGFE